MQMQYSRVRKQADLMAIPSACVYYVGSTDDVVRRSREHRLVPATMYYAIAKNMMSAEDTLIAHHKPKRNSHGRAGSVAGQGYVYVLVLGYTDPDGVYKSVTIGDGTPPAGLPLVEDDE